MRSRGDACLLAHAESCCCVLPSATVGTTQPRQLACGTARGATDPGESDTLGGGSARLLRCRHTAQEHAQTCAPQDFYVLADLSWDAPSPASEADDGHVLLRARAHADGTLEFSPPVHTDGADGGLCGLRQDGVYQVRDAAGRLYEYTIRLVAAAAGDSKLGERKQQLWAAYERVMLQQACASLPTFAPPPRQRWHFSGEIVSARGFDQARLYVEYVVCYDRRAWRLLGPDWLLLQRALLGDLACDEHIERVRPRSRCHAAASLPACSCAVRGEPPAIVEQGTEDVQVPGCTHISRGRATSHSPQHEPSAWQAHFAHPLELVFERMAPRIDRQEAGVEDTGYLAPTLCLEVRPCQTTAATAR